MKKWLALLTVILTAASAVAQSIPASQSRVAGRFVAYNYGLWNTYPASISPATGLQTFTVLNSYVNLGDGRLISPYSTNAALRIGTETVTPSAVSTCYVNDVRIGVCQITATFTLSHTNSDKISSATFGLQEALNDAGNSGGGAVTVDSAWAGVGGTTAIISGATIPANTSIEDARTGVPAGPGAVTPSLQYSMFYQPNSGTAAAAVGDPSITTDGAGNLHAGSLAAATAVTSANTVLYVKAAPFNAKCDGVTDDQVAIQAAFDAAYSTGASVQFPAGTCLTSTIVYKGQSFFGSGTTLTFVKGKPGQDVFQSPDSSVTILLNSYIHDLDILVDTSVDASATINGGNNTFPNRIAGTVQGTTAFNTPIAPGPLVFGYGGCATHGATISLSTPTTVTISCAITNNLTLIQSSRVIGAPITITGAGVAGADLTTTITAVGSFVGSTQTLTIATPASTAVTGTTGSMLNAITPPWYIGNAGIALQCSNGAACANNISRLKIVNVLFEQTDNPAGCTVQCNHAAAIFTQLAPYNGLLDTVSTNLLYAGYIEAAPTTGRIVTPDTLVMRNLNFTAAVLPLVTYNGSNRTLTGINMYASGGIQSNCNYFLANNQTTSAVSTWKIDGLYCEGATTQGGEVARFAPGPFKIFSTDFMAGTSTQGYTQFIASGSVWDGLMGGGLTVNGGGNVFRNTRLFTANITDNGQNNTFDSATVSGTNSYMQRRSNPSIRPYRDPVGKSDGTFIATGNSFNPYGSVSDLYTNCDDWAFTQSGVGQGVCATDTTSGILPARYFQSTTPTQRFDLLIGGTAATSAWSGEARVYGSNTVTATGSSASIVPTTKVVIYVLGECVGTATCSATQASAWDLTTNTNVGTLNNTVNFTSSWGIASFAADLTGATVGDIASVRINNWTNAGTSYRIAAFWWQPINNDEHTWLYTNGLPVSSSVNLKVVDTTGAGITTGPTSTTNGDIMVADGTTGKIKDGGPVPAAVQVAVPLWLQAYGDGSEGAFTCPSGTCDLQTGEHWYSTCNISAGAIVDAKSSTLSAGAPLVIRCSTSATIAGTISYTINTGSSNGTTTAANYGGGSGGGGFGAANGAIGNGYLAAIGAGAAGTTGVTGGTGTATPAYVQKIFLSSGYPYTGTACGGGVGGAGGSSGGAGGRGAGCIIIISPSINFTGTCDVSGQNGVAGGANTGGGGGGAGGICLFRSPSMTNSGTFTVTGGLGGAIGTGTSTAGGPGAVGWSKVFAQ